MAAASEEKELFLWDHPVSSYAQKIRIALREKGIPFDFATPRGGGSGNPSVTDPNFSAQNLRVEIPLLVAEHGALRIFDSTVILEYLEDKYPEPALLSKASEDPAARAKARMIEEICDTQYEAINWGLGEVRGFKRVEGGEAEKLARQAEHQIRQVQTWLMEHLGDAEWFGGDRFGWADLCVVPMVNRSRTWGISPVEGSTLAKWFARVKERPSVSETLKECDQALAMAGSSADALKKGLIRREYRDHRLEWMVKSGGIDIVLAGLTNKNIRFSWPNPLE